MLGCRDRQEIFLVRQWTEPNRLGDAWREIGLYKVVDPVSEDPHLPTPENYIL
jgi:hypothetical protein